MLYPGRPLSEAVRRNRVRGKILERRPQAHQHRLLVALANGGEVEVLFSPACTAPWPSSRAMSWSFRSAPRPWWRCPGPRVPIDRG